MNGLETGSPVPSEGPGRTDWTMENTGGDDYMAMPDGIETPVYGPWVCKLRNSLHGIKQTPRLWYERIDTFLRSLGLLRSEYGSNVYISTGSHPPTQL
jgi:hypothetical protein